MMLSSALSHAPPRALHNVNYNAVFTVGKDLASVQSVLPVPGGGYWSGSADGGSNGHAIDADNRFDCAFVLPASRTVSRSSCVGDWLAQSPRADELDHFDVDQFWAEGESPLMRSFGSHSTVGWGGTPKSTSDAWGF
jgi:hypothetical protein